jgi:hypothetical protein
VGEETDPEDVVFLIEKWEKKTKRKSEKLFDERRKALLASLSERIDPR